MVTILNNQLILHLVIREDIFNEEPNKTLTFTFNNCYLSNTFQGIMPDNGATGVLTTRNPQFLILQKLDPTV